MQATTADLPAYLFVLPWSLASLGGVNQVVLNLARQMAQRGRFRPIVWICDWEATTPRWETVHGVATVRWRLRPEGLDDSFKARTARALWRWRFMTRFRRFCAEHRVAVVNPHYANDSAFTLHWLTTRLSLPLIVSFHGADLARIEAGGTRDRQRWKLLAANVRAFVACSRNLAGRMALALGEDVATVIHNGLDADAFVALAGSESVERTDAHRALLSIGKFEAKKGHDVLLRAFALLRPAHPDIRLVIAGASDAALPALKELAGALGVEGAVRFLPDTPHPVVARLLRDAAVFVLPSRAEPFGIVLLEAGSFGLPVVASRVGGIPEILTDGDTGILVPPDHPQALADALRRVLADPGKAAAMGERLQHHVRARFTWGAALDDYLALLSPTARTHR